MSFEELESDQKVALDDEQASVDAPLTLEEQERLSEGHFDEPDESDYNDYLTGNLSKVKPV